MSKYTVSGTVSNQYLFSGTSFVALWGFRLSPGVYTQQQKETSPHSVNIQRWHLGFIEITLGS